jgi:hypothetical protein
MHVQMKKSIQYNNYLERKQNSFKQNFFKEKKIRIKFSLRTFWKEFLEGNSLWSCVFKNYI